MKLLSLALIVAISCPSFADEIDESKDKRVKQALVIGGVVTGGIVGWRILKYANLKMGRVIDKGDEAIARRSRMPLANRGAGVEITNPPIYRLTAPDGSQHHILGTMHISNISLSDFPKNSILPILKQANIMMPECADITSFTAVIRSRLSPVFKRLRRTWFVPKQKLSEQLGEHYWQELTQMIAKKPDIKPFEQSIDEFMADLDASTASDVYLRLVDYGASYASPSPIRGLQMDTQLIRYGREHGKKIIGLETLKEARITMRAHKRILAEEITVDELKKLIDKGGIDYRTKIRRKMIKDYAEGKKLQYNYSQILQEVMLDRRNIAWMKTGKIQKNCVKGNNCLIFVGAGHLDKGDRTLINLLQEEGYRIERL